MASVNRAARLLTGLGVLPLLPLLPLLLSCASSGTEPHAMTAGQHQAAAQSEERAAAAHQAQYEPSKVWAAPDLERCLLAEYSNCEVRWATTKNPTDTHRKQAEQHKKLAEKHRAASKALVEAEQRFCSGISAGDRDLSPFYHREDVTAVEGVKEMTSTIEYGYVGGGSRVVRIQQVEKEVLGPGGLQGARITFRAVPGMSGEWLQRVVDCHLARNAVVGGADMPFCPLAVPHAAATVMSTGNGFAVDVTSDNVDSVREIIKRATALGPSGSTTVVK